MPKLTQAERRQIIKRFKACPSRTGSRGRTGGRENLKRELAEEFRVGIGTIENVVRDGVVTHQHPETVYFFLAEEMNRVKIGYTHISVAKRLMVTQPCSPCRLECIGVIPGSREMERQIHAKLRPWRVIGEWFEYNDHVHEYVARLLKEQSDDRESLATRQTTLAD